MKGKRDIWVFWPHRVRVGRKTSRSASDGRSVTSSRNASLNILTIRNITPKERCDRGRTVPTTVRIAAVMFLYVQGMIAKDRMKIRGFILVFLERVSTGGADMRFMVNQD